MSDNRNPNRPQQQARPDSTRPNQPGQRPDQQRRPQQAQPNRNNREERR